jgi:hypothetical protein
VIAGRLTTRVLVSLAALPIIVSCDTPTASIRPNSSVGAVASQSSAPVGNPPSAALDRQAAAQVPAKVPGPVPVTSPTPAPATEACPAMIGPAVQLHGVVNAGAASVRLCGFSDGAPMKQRPVGGVVEGASAADALALLLRNSPPAGSGLQCGQLTPGVLLSFHYRSGPDVDVPLITYGCPQPVAYVDGTARALDNALAQLLLANAGSYGVPGQPVPNIVGLPVNDASLRSAGYTIATDGEEIDAAVPAGTVLAQDPPAGSGDIGNRIEVITATRQARPCTSRDLSLTYQGAGPSEGNDFGNIEMLDRSSVPCELTGPITVTGVGKTGRVDTDRLSYSVTSALILRPGASAAMLQLGADYRDDVAGPNGMCVQNRVVPSRWRLGLLGGTLTVANASVDAPYPEFSSLITCHGELDTPEPVSLS